MSTVQMIINVVKCRNRLYRTKQGFNHLINQVLKHVVTRFKILSRMADMFVVIYKLFFPSFLTF